jgi:glycosyltransferase involved in cell wall biosynthesis
LKYELVVFVSVEAEVKAKVEFNLKNTTTIYNVYIFPASKLRKVDGDKVIKLGSISRLNKTKNIDLLIRVLRKVVTTEPNVKLFIYGSGEQQKLLEVYVKNQQCENYITLSGPCNDKGKMYSSIDAIVSFSSIEGLPTTILEGIGYGVPIFYTDCSSGPRELMSPYTDPTVKTSSYEKTNVGYLVKPAKKMAAYSTDLDDYELDYVDIMLSFINDLRVNKFDMSYDAVRFSEEIILKQWQNLVEGFS